MRTLLVCSLLLATTVCFAQTTSSPSVVVGQNAAGQNTLLTVIELKYLDPVVAADLLAALGYGGVAIIPAGGPSGRPSEGLGSYQGAGRASRASSHRGRDYDGYGGYQDAQRTGERYQGYQSPYDYR